MATASSSLIELDDLDSKDTAVMQAAFNCGDTAYPYPTSDFKNENVNSVDNNYGTVQNDSEKNKGPSYSMEDAFRRRLKFFFMDPISKFQARRHNPWKLIVQFMKIVIITLQVVLFGAQRYGVVEFFDHNHIALKHLMLKGWNPSYNTDPNAAGADSYAVYDKNSIYQTLDFAWAQYYRLEDSALASIILRKDDQTHRDLPMTLCFRFSNHVLYPNGTHVINTGISEDCVILIPLNESDSYQVERFLDSKNKTIPFSVLLDLSLQFSYINIIQTNYGSSCYLVNAKIMFVNSGRSGQVVIDLKTETKELTCSSKTLSPKAAEEEKYEKSEYLAIDAIVIIMCAFSFVLCTRSLIRGWHLKKKTEEFFRLRFDKELEFADRSSFISFWYILIICNDIATVVGSFFKIELEMRNISISSDNYDRCGLMLGMGICMAWIGILRYLSYFKKYNILILTLKTAFPAMLRFCVCVLAIYFGFLFCGWIILGPYHSKFRNISTASETLFSLVNGDDMFTTFSTMESKNVLVWYFARVYLYTFISLFVYGVISVFISVIMETYEALKHYQKEGFPKTEMQKYIDECDDPLHSGLYHRQHTDADGFVCSIWSCFSSCSRIPNKEESSEHEPLLSPASV